MFPTYEQISMDFCQVISATGGTLVRVGGGGRMDDQLYMAANYKSPSPSLKKGLSIHQRLPYIAEVLQQHKKVI